MRPLRDRLRDAVRATHISGGGAQPVVEKDYALTYVLVGMASVNELLNGLVFKGGTALRKCYFGADYRFSEDLDFSSLPGAPTGDDLEWALNEAADITRELLVEQGNFDIHVARRLERDPHPGGQEQFDVRVQFPWQPEPYCRIKLEITHDEPVLLAPVSMPILHGYEEPDPGVEINCYEIEEIIAEKLRTLRQTDAKIELRGWNRPRARDYYDLWRLFSDFGDSIRYDTVVDLLAEKMAVRGVGYETIDDFFTERLLDNATRSWDSQLAAFVPGLETCEEVIDSLQAFLPDILPAAMPARSRAA